VAIGVKVLVGVLVGVAVFVESQLGAPRLVRHRDHAGFRRRLLVRVQNYAFDLAAGAGQHNLDSAARSRREIDARFQNVFAAQCRGLNVVILWETVHIQLVVSGNDIQNREAPIGLHRASGPACIIRAIWLQVDLQVRHIG
jgi:hypothetical protein